MTGIRKKFNGIRLTLTLLTIAGAVIFIFPVLIILINSFKPDALIFLNPLSFPVNRSDFYFQNYLNAWIEVEFHRVFFNTLIITSVSTSFIILFSSMAGYALIRQKSRLSWFLFLLFTFAMVVPFQVIMIPLVQISRGLHLDNVAGIIPVYIGLGTPLAVFMYHGFMKTIPLELEESAAIDGAGVFTIFFRIVLPLLGPVTSTIAILDILWIWNDYLLPLIILPAKTTIQLSASSFFVQFKNEYGKAMAALVLSSLPVVLFYLFMQKYIIKGILSGAVKG